MAKSVEQSELFTTSFRRDYRGLLSFSPTEIRPQGLNSESSTVFNPRGLNLRIIFHKLLLIGIWRIHAKSATSLKSTCIFGDISFGSCLHRASRALEKCLRALICSENVFLNIESRRRKRRKWKPEREPAAAEL